MRFTKMHGVGNDFLIFDPGEVEDEDLPRLARKACDRHFGVGADGILIPVPSQVADLKMVYLNSDGSGAEMCGNGIRCLARYARDYEIVEGDALTIETGTGINKILLSEDGSSRVNMGPPQIDSEVTVGGFRFLRVSMGNPHAVTFLESEGEVEELDLSLAGAVVGRAPVFPRGTNVEFACVRGPGAVRMRVWERGAGETLASGTGSCATAVAAIHLGLAGSPVEVHLDGGVVEIGWFGDGDPVFMHGPAGYICEGELLR